MYEIGHNFDNEKMREKNGKKENAGRDRAGQYKV